MKKLSFVSLAWLVEIKKLIFKELEKRFQLETYPVPSRRIDKNDQKNSPYCPQVFVS
jgi:hypothetical protein